VPSGLIVCNQRSAGSGLNIFKPKKKSNTLKDKRIKLYNLIKTAEQEHIKRPWQQIEDDSFELLRTVGLLF